jgi:antagonist of KipI
MSLQILKPGLLTSVQDQGRWGSQRYGVVVGGAVDGFAAAVANMIVGNDEHSAVLEMALIGPELRAQDTMLVAVCGADFDFRVNGVAIRRGRPVLVHPGEVLSFGQAKQGARAWLAVAGGIDVPAVLGSRSTHVRGRMGGIEGRPLIGGDVIPIGAPSVWAGRLRQSLQTTGKISPSWSIRPETLGRHSATGRVRTVPGPEWSLFTPEAHHRLFNETYRVTKDVDRMGMRLAGPMLEPAVPREEISSAVNVGVVQVPTSGQPIVLLTGRQTVGGYPRIAAVATVDLGQLAQLKPGDTLGFEEITLAQAHELLLLRTRDFGRARDGIARLFA